MKKIFFHKLFYKVGNRKEQKGVSGREDKQTETYRMRAPFSIVCEFYPLVCGGVHLLALIILNLWIKHKGPSKVS